MTFLDFTAYIIIILAFYSAGKKLFNIFIPSKKTTSCSSGCASCSAKCELRKTLVQ